MIIGITRMAEEIEKSPATIYLDGQKFTTVDTENCTIAKVEDKKNVTVTIECGGFVREANVDCNGDHDTIEIRLKWTTDPRDLVLDIKSADS